MVIDSSAFAAILFGEPERAAFCHAIVSQQTRLTSAATLLETTMIVLSRKGEPGIDELHAFLDGTRIETTPFEMTQLERAVDAFRRFGRGRHRAALNFGDCFSYALAKATGEPLLFKGDGFSHTDITRAI